MQAVQQLAQQFNELRNHHASCNKNKCCVVIHRTIKKDGCDIKVPGDGAIFLDCDTCEVFASQDTKKPDVLGIYFRDNPPRWVIIEMKSKAHDISDIIEQLRAGVRVIRENERFNLVPKPEIAILVLLHHGIKQADSDNIKERARKVRFGAKPCLVVVKRCGSKLEEIL